MKVTSIFILCLMLFACTPKVDDALLGQQIFEKTHLGESKSMGCIVCHAINPGENSVGPSLKGLGSRAGETIPGVTAREYLYESIVNPDAYVVEGYLPAIMDSKYSKTLNEQQINSLVNYLLTL